MHSLSKSWNRRLRASLRTLTRNQCRSCRSRPINDINPANAAILAVYPDISPQYNSGELDDGRCRIINPVCHCKPMN